MNVLFIMDDQHHPEAMSCLKNCPKGLNGKPLIDTPNFNRLMSRGVYFKHAYTPTAICVPSRTSIFTGTYCMTHGQFGNDCRNVLEPEISENSMPAIFRNHGHTTAYWGKGHIPDCITQHFDEIKDIQKYKKEYLSSLELSDKHHCTPVADMQFEAWSSSIPKEHSSEVWTAEHALKFLDTHPQNTPFFAWLTFERPHSPHAPDAETESLVDPDNVPLPWDDYELFEQTKIQPRPGREDYWNLGGWQNPKIYQKAVARYYSLIGLIDEQIGRVLDKLDEKGLAENTLIIFCPDHGDFGGDYGQLGKNVPVYEQLYKVPMIWCDPTRPQDYGKVVEGLWETIDIYPSLMDRMGWELPAQAQGTSFLRAIDGWRPVGKEHVFFETPMCKMIRTREYKLAFHLDHPQRGQLFRMLPVPDELNDLWDDPLHREARERLTLDLLAHIVKSYQIPTADPKWEPLIPNWYNRSKGLILEK